MHDAGQLALGKRPAGVEIQQHRGRRLLALAQKGGLTGHGQMDPRGAHAVHGRYRSRQFGLQGAMEARLLHKG